MTDTNSGHYMPTGVASSISSQFMSLELTGTGGPGKRAKLNEGKAILANALNGDSATYSATQNIFPAPYSTDYDAMVTAYNAVRTNFYEKTLAYGFQMDASGKEKARSSRLIANRKLVDGSFMRDHNALVADLDAKREDCAQTIVGQVAALERSGQIGDSFDWSKYPTPEQIRAGWRYEPLVPMPLASPDQLRSLPLTPELVASIESTMNAQMEANLRFGQQQMVKETLSYLQTMVKQLTKLSDWAKTGTGKRTPIHESLVTNIVGAVEKLRTYAIPTDPVGVKLLAAADRIEEELSLRVITAADLKERPRDAGGMAKTASQVADDLTSDLAEMFDLSPSARAPVTEIHAPIVAEPPAVPAPLVSQTVDPLDDLLAEWV